MDMRKIASQMFAAVSLITVSMPTPAAAQSFSFGNDSSRYSRDGECDDKRFSGSGMTDTPLLDSDIGHDATDCRAAYNQGRLRYIGGGGGGGGGGNIQWGNDSSRYSRDGECDDKRFVGSGMTDTPLLDSDIGHDATDCRAAYNQGRLTLRQ
jgi:hypothetical protein